MNRRVLWAVCVLATASCGRKDDVQLQNQPGLLDPEGNTRKPAPIAPKPYKPAPGPEPFANDYRPQPVEAPVLPAAAQPDAGAEPDATQARDLDAELSTAMARVTSCVDLPAAAAQRDGRLVVSASAVVLATGRISRVNVAAPGQPPSALSCLQREVLSLRLPDGVPGAPLTVRGTTELTVKPARAQVADAGTPPAIPVAPTVPVTPSNPNLAQPQADDMAKPDTEGLAGPP